MSLEIKQGNLVIHEKINQLIKEKENDVHVRKADYELYNKKLKEAQELMMKEFGFEVNVNQQGHNLRLNNLSKARYELKIIQDLKKTLIKENCF